MVIAAGFQHFGTNDLIYEVSGEHEFMGVQLSDRIYITATSWQGSASTSGSRAYKVVLMKIA